MSALVWEPFAEVATRGWVKLEKIASGAPIWLRGSKRKSEARKCLTEGCEYLTGGDHGGGRGLCKKCHGAARAMIKRKKTTWEELEELGFAEPAICTNFERRVRLERKRRRQNG